MWLLLTPLLMLSCTGSSVLAVQKSSSDENDRKYSPAMTREDRVNLFNSCKSGNMPPIEALVRKYDGSILNKRDTAKNSTCLHYAVRKSHVELVEYLLEYKQIDINAYEQMRTDKNKYHFTPLLALFASKHDNSSDQSLKIARLLLNRKADPNMKSHLDVKTNQQTASSQSALDLAICCYNASDKAKMIELLQSKGAKCWSYITEGLTRYREPLMAQCEGAGTSTSSQIQLFSLLVIFHLI